MVDEWKEFTAETEAEAIAAAKGHFSVSDAQLDLRFVPREFGVSGLGSRVLLLASVKDEPQELGDVGEFLQGVLERMNLATGLRIRESGDEGELRFGLSGRALEEAVRGEGSITGALGHLAERVAQQSLGEDARVRIEIVSSRGGERRDGRREGRRDSRGDGRGRGESRGRGDGRGRNDRRRGGEDRERGGRNRSRDDSGDERLERLAIRIAEEVRASGGERLLDPMSSRERWIVHNAIKSVEGVTSESVSERDEKRVKIVAL